MLAFPQMQALGIKSPDGIFTNLGLLLSDQCPQIIKAAAFSGTDQEAFQDRRELTGPFLKQVDDAYAFLDKHSETSAASEGVHRIDHRACPTAVLREALLNAIVHRDYAYSACTLISVYGKHKICTYAPAFFLRETAGNGEEHFTVSCEGVNILLYKPDGYSHLLQVPDRFQKVNDVAGKPADVFRQDNVD